LFRVNIETELRARRRPLQRGGDLIDFSPKYRRRRIHLEAYRVSAGHKKKRKETVCADPCRERDLFSKIDHPPQKGSASDRLRHDRRPNGNTRFLANDSRVSVSLGSLNARKSEEGGNGWISTIDSKPGKLGSVKL